MTSPIIVSVGTFILYLLFPSVFSTIFVSRIVCPAIVETCLYTYFRRFPAVNRDKVRFFLSAMLKWQLQTAPSIEYRDLTELARRQIFHLCASPKKPDVFSSETTLQSIPAIFGRYTDFVTGKSGALHFACSVCTVIPMRKLSHFSRIIFVHHHTCKLSFGQVKEYYCASGIICELTFYDSFALSICYFRSIFMQD